VKRRSALDKLARSGGHDDVDFKTLALQRTHQLRRFVAAIPPLTPTVTSSLDCRTVLDARAPKPAGVVRPFSSAEWEPPAFNQRLLHLGRSLDIGDFARVNLVLAIRQTLLDWLATRACDPPCNCRPSCGY